MIKVKRDEQGVVRTAVIGKPLDVTEELLSATVSIIEILVEKGKLPKEKVIGFIDDFAQQVKDNIKIEEGK